MLKTGIEPSAASSSTTACGPVRTPTACAWRLRTSAVSLIDSPRSSCSSPGRSTIGWPPSSTTPASNDSRVRVLGRSNNSAITLSRSASDERGAAFSSAARSSSAASSPELSSAPVRKWRVKNVSLVLVLTWNLFHGRAVPPAGRDLLAEFAATLAGWEWDVALLQEVPPWWPPELGRASRASARRALTSRNVCVPVQRALAERWPDIIKSWGGGANAILVRGPRVLEQRRLALRWRPERRVVHAVRLDSGLWIGNLHAQVHSEERAQADI